MRCVRYETVRAADFVVPTETGLDLYSQPYDARYPVICMDEQHKQLLADKRSLQPARPGRPAPYDYAYARRGPCTLWLCVEPLGRGAGPWTGRAAALPERGPGLDGAAFRAWRGLEAVLPPRARYAHRPHSPARCRARNAVARDLGWLNRGRRVDACSDPYARRFLGFLDLTAAWIWLKSKSSALPRAWRSAHRRASSHR